MSKISKMSKSQNATIIVLLISAAILTTMLVAGFYASQQQANADASVRQGRYIMATGAYSKSIDLIYVLDVNNGTLVTLVPNNNKKSLDIVGRKLNLSRAMGMSRRGRR